MKEAFVAISLTSQGMEKLIIIHTKNEANGFDLKSHFSD
jgi:hypothetical protein